MYFEFMATVNGYLHSKAAIDVASQRNNYILLDPNMASLDFNSRSVPEVTLSHNGEINSILLSDFTTREIIGLKQYSEVHSNFCLQDWI